MFGWFKKKTIPKYEIVTEVHKFPAGKVKLTYHGKHGEVLEFIETVDFTEKASERIYPHYVEEIVKDSSIADLIGNYSYADDGWGRGGDIFIKSDNSYISTEYYTLGTTDILEEYTTDIEIKVSREIKYE